MMRFLFFLLIIAFSANGCSDRLPTPIDPGETLHYDTTASKNSFVTEGAGYRQAVFDMDSEGNIALEQDSGRVIEIVQSSIVRQPGYDPVTVSLVLQFPNARGEVSWENLMEKPRDSTSVWGMLFFDGNQYVSVEGATDVIFAQDVTNYVSGTFSGTFVTAFSDTIQITEGRFHLPVEAF